MFIFSAKTLQGTGSSFNILLDHEYSFTLTGLRYLQATILHDIVFFSITQHLKIKSHRIHTDGSLRRSVCFIDPAFRRFLSEFLIYFDHDWRSLNHLSASFYLRDLFTKYCCSLPAVIPILFRGRYKLVKIGRIQPSSVA